MPKKNRYFYYKETNMTEEKAQDTMTPVLKVLHFTEDKADVAGPQH